AVWLRSVVCKILKAELDWKIFVTFIASIRIVHRGPCVRRLVCSMCLLENRGSNGLRNSQRTKGEPSKHGQNRQSHRTARPIRKELGGCGSKRSHGICADSAEYPPPS